MAGKFVLTAEIRMRAPKNLKRVAQQIRSNLGGKTTEVKVQVKGAKKTAAELARVEKAVEKAGSSAKAAQSKFNVLGSAIGQAVVHVARYDVARRIVTAFGQAIGRATKDAIAFEREIIKVSQVTGKSVQSLKFLNTEITRLATSFGVSSSSLVKTTRILAQAGLTAKQTKSALEALAKTTLAPTFDDISSTTETSIAVMSQFGLEASRLESVLGKINKVAGSFAVEAGDLGTAIKRAGGVFKSAGGSVEELIGLFTSVRSTTRETAETIATGFRTIFTRLQRPTTLKFLRKFGVELRNLEGQFVGPFEAVRRLNAVLKDLDPRDIRYAQITEQLGGFRQVSKVIPLIQQFEKAQKAYNVALDGGSSLAKDAQAAQQGLAVQFTKVREEFTALIRAISNDTVFRGMIELATNMARAFIRVADSIKPLIPLLTAFATFSIARGVGRFAMGRGGGGGRGGAIPGVFGVNKGGKIKGYARGGMVPGQGNADTVPAMLQPGEFVIRKSAVQAHGAGTLAGMNRASSGGKIRRKYNRGGEVVIRTAEDMGGRKAIRERTVRKKIERQAEKLREGTLYNDGDKFKTTIKRRHTRVSDDDLNYKTDAGRAGRDNPLNKNKVGFSDRAGAQRDPINFGHFFEALTIRRKRLSKIKSKKGAPTAGDVNAPLDALGRDGLYEIKAGPVSPKKILEKRTAYAIEKRRGKFGQLTTQDDPDKSGVGPVELSTVNLAQPRFVGGASASGKKKKSAVKVTRNKGGVIPTGFASGGAVDTVPALLTPGEFVFNRESAQKIGYSKLNTMNKFARGGPVQKFAKGGPVWTKFAEGGGNPMVLGGSRPNPGKNLGAFVKANKDASKGLKATGDAGRKTGRDLLGMAFVLTTVSESFVQTDGVVKDVVQSLTQFALTTALVSSVIAGEKMTAAFASIGKQAGIAGGLLSGLSVGLIAGSFAISSFVDTLTAADIKAGGEARRGAADKAAIGGGIAGAVGGAGLGLAGAGAFAAATGATVGTGGLALLVIIPALIGALLFGGKKFGDAAKAIQKADFADKLSDIEDTFQRFQKGRISAGFALQDIAGQAGGIRNVIERDPSQRAEFLGDISKITKTAKELAFELAKDSKTLAEFDTVAGAAIREVEALGQTSFKRLRAEVAKQIEAQQKAVVAQAKLEQAIEQTFITLNLQKNVASSFKEMTARVQEASRGLVVFSTLASGRLALGKPRAVGRLLQKPEDIVDFSAFAAEINKVDKELQGMGLSAEQITKLSGPAKKAGEVLSKLPTVLLAAAKAPATAKPGFTLVDRVLESLGLEPGGSDDAVASALTAALENVGADLAGKIKADPEGINSKVAQALTPFLKSHAEGAKFIDASNKNLAAALQQRAQLELQLSQEEAKLHTLRLQSLKIISEARGVDVTLADIKREEAKRRKALLGTAGGDTDVESLSVKLRDLGNEIVEADRAYELGLISFKQLQDKTDGLRSQFARVTLVLREYAQIQKQVADEQRKLSEIRSQREKKVSTLQDAAFSSLPDIIKLSDNFNRLTALGAGGKRLTPGDPINKELLSLLRSFGNVSLPAFGRITSEELSLRGLSPREIAQRQETRPSRTGSELAAFKTLELFRQIRGPQGVTDEVAKQILGGVSTPEQKLIETIKQASKDAARAQAALVEHLGRTSTELGHVIQSQNREFLRGLKELFQRSLVQESTLKKQEADASKARAQAQDTALRQTVPDALSTALSFRGPGDPANIRALPPITPDQVRGELTTDVLKAIDANLTKIKGINEKRVIEQAQNRARRATDRQDQEGGFGNLRKVLQNRRANILYGGGRIAAGEAFRQAEERRTPLPELKDTEPRRQSRGQSPFRFGGTSPFRDKPFGGLLGDRPAEGTTEIFDFRNIAKLLGFSKLIEEKFQGSMTGDPSKTVDFLGGALPEALGNEIFDSIIDSLSDMGIEGTDIPGLTELGKQLREGVGFPLDKFTEVLAEIRQKLDKENKDLRTTIDKDMRDILRGPLGAFFRQLGIDGETAIALLARESANLKDVFGNLDEFDLSKAQQELNRTETEASNAAGALKTLNDQLEKLREDNKRERLRELEEGKRRRGRRDHWATDEDSLGGGPAVRSAVGIAAVGGGINQFSATKGGDRLLTDDPTSHAILESIHRSLASGRETRFSKTGGVVYAKMGAGIPNWKPRGTDTVPAQTPDGQPYGLTPGERVMSVKATKAFGPQLAKMERSAQSGIGLAKGGVIYGQKGVSTGIKAKFDELWAISEMPQDMQNSIQIWVMTPTRRCGWV